jgi:hypothetical protein
MERLQVSAGCPPRLPFAIAECYSRRKLIERRTLTLSLVWRSLLANLFRLRFAH